MKKILLAAICLFTAFGTMTAQDFIKGDKVLNLGIGIGNTIHSGSGYSMTVPPLSASFEYCIVDNLFDDKSSIGIGGYFGYSASQYKHNYGLIQLQDLKIKYSDIVLAARGAFHYQFLNKLDTYGGLAIGYDFMSVNENGTVGSYDVSSSRFFTGFFLGGRYYFNEKIAAMAEVGYDVAILNVGIAIKL